VIAIFLKEKEKLVYGDVVTPTVGYFKGRKGLVCNKTTSFFPFRDEIKVIFQLKMTNDVITQYATFLKHQLIKVLPEFKLIRPLRVGDFICLAENFETFYGQSSLPFQGKTLPITAIDESSESPLIFHYITNGSQWRWREVNLDIPKTNRLIMEQNRPRVVPRLPEI